MNKTKKQKMVIVIVLMFVLIILIAVIVNRIDRLEIKIQNEVGEEKMETFLKVGHQIEVISLNLDQDVNMEGRGEMDEWYSKVHKQPPKPMKEMVEESLAEGKKWDIIGFQELLRTKKNPPGRSLEAEEFIAIMKELIPERNYSCLIEEQKGLAICSWFPFVPNSYREELVWQNADGSARRYVQCALIQTPAGQIPFCNTHLRANSDPASQFVYMENVLYNTILPSYIPAEVHPDSRATYNASLRARIIITGDMNYTPSGTEKFSSVCMNTWKATAVKNGGQCGIDQVMITRMNDSLFSHSQELKRQFLVPEGGYLDLTRPWPTDHLGPIVALVSTQELTLPIRYVIASSSSTTPTPYATPTPTPPTSDTQQQERLSLNLITFNIGAFTISQTYFDARIDPVARYLGKGNYDIIALQETSYGRREGERIAQRLEDFGYGKYYVAFSEHTISENSPNQHGKGVYVLSKYPVSTLYSQYGIGRSVLAKIEHPQLGLLYVASVHPSNDSRCKQPKQILEKVAREQQEIKNNTILMGDMNAYPQNVDTEPSFKALKGDMCGEQELLSTYDFSCVNRNSCWNTGAIDWILTQKGSVFRIESRDYHPNVYAELGTFGLPGTSWHGVDIHKPVSAKIIVNKPVIATTPIATPSLVASIPIGGNTIIDLNEDGKVDITDFALFVEYYKAGNVKIDFDKDGESIRDIDDLSYFIQEYKKEKPDGNE